MEPGTQVGQYRIVRKLGEGGMGAVYVAEHTMLGRRAAMKMLLPALSAQREIVDRFFNEARATTSMSDPGIVQVFDFGFHTDGTAFIVMELLEGESLDARLKRFGHLPAADAVRICRQAAGSLASAHARGIVHRDLKPENIFLVRDAEAQGGERPKVLDFGIAKLGGNDANRMRTQTGALMGTPIYMSPEQCRGAGSVDHRSDIYSLGCVLFHLLTGRPPFDGEGMGEIIASHLREPARPPSALVPGLLPELDALVLRTLEKDPGKRLDTMTELARALEAVQTRITAVGAGGAGPSTATPLAPGFRSEYPGVGAVQAQVTSNGTTPVTAAPLPANAPSVAAAAAGGTPTAALSPRAATTSTGSTTSAPTTLAGAAAESAGGRRGGRGLMLGLLFLAAVGGGAIVAVMATGGGADTAPPTAGSGAAGSGSAASAGSGSAASAGSGSAASAGSGSAASAGSGSAASAGSGSAAAAGAGGPPPDAAPVAVVPPDAAPAAVTSPATSTEPAATGERKRPPKDRTRKPPTRPKDGPTTTTTTDDSEDLYDSR